jgi:hypothetical protein
MKERKKCNFEKKLKYETFKVFNLQRLTTIKMMRKGLRQKSNNTFFMAVKE